MDNMTTAAKYIRDSKNIIAFTGAGVSTESNIPDFRSAGGLFKSTSGDFDYPPEKMLSHSFFMEHAQVFFEYYLSRLIHKDALPNKCHLAFSKLEDMGKLKAVITQNIDGLHQAAGSRNVLELHGSVHRNYCMKCRRSFSLDYVTCTAGRIAESSLVPVCDKCGGIVRPDVVLYEEMLDTELMEKAVEYIRKADVLIVAGTSLVVYPAAGLVSYYKGSKLILLNKSQTSYDSRANILINGSAGEIMADIMEMAGL